MNELLSTIAASTSTLTSTTMSTNVIAVNVDHCITLVVSKTVSSKQNPKDYGYRFSRPSPTYIYEVYSCGFTEDENRDKAHTKWNTWWNDNGQTWLKENGKSESPDESK